MADVPPGAIQNPANGHWYLRVSSSVNLVWSDCKTAAEQAGGYLATVTDAAEQQWLYSNLVTGQPVTYLGATDAATEGSWQWANGEAWVYTQWASGQPNNGGGNIEQDYVVTGGPYANAWDDDDGATASDNNVRGYVIEWGGGFAPPPPVDPPAPPINLAATYSDASGVTLTWNDASSNETGFWIERKPAGYSFAHRDSTAANVTFFVDQALFPSTTYTYRVRAFNSGGDSAYSNEASVTTSAAVPRPSAPKAPTQLTASCDANGTVDAAWRDNSVDETFFELERAVGGAAFARASLEAPDVTSCADGPLHPGWPCTYRVRALSLQGPSPWSNTAETSIPSTLDVTSASGSLTDSAKRKGDRLKIAAAYAFPAAAPADAALDPVVNGLELQLGAANAPLDVSIVPSDTTWKVKTKKGKPVLATWKSAKGASPRVTVAVDLVRHIVTATVTGADYPAAPAPLVRVLLASGADGGAREATWTARKPGVLVSK